MSKPLSKAAKKARLLQAAENIFLGRAPFSCVALALTREGEYQSIHTESLCLEYADFLVEGELRPNHFVDSSTGTDAYSQLARQLALLFFRESL